MSSCVETAPGPLKSHMRTMAGLDNIPRKEKQFRNFTANSLNLRGKNGDAIVGDIWNLLKTAKDKRQAEKETEKQGKNEQEDKAQQQSPNDATKEANEEATTEALGTKESAGESKAESSTSGFELDPKTVHKTMKKVLKEAPNRSMKLKELRRILGEKLGLPKTLHKRLKKLIQDTPDTSKKTKLKVEGKVIMLI